MKLLTRNFLFLGLSFSLAGCASYFKKRECEKTDWRQHGYNVAMSGKRLDADAFINECARLDAETIRYQDADVGFKDGMSKYCNLDSVFSTGKSGALFNYDMCDGLSRKSMEKKYHEGILIYCQKDNGYPVGSSGASYNKVCPKELEPNFLSEYRRGRRVYLANVIEGKEHEIEDLNREISRARDEKDDKLRELSRIGTGKTLVRESKYDPVSHTYREEVREQEDPGIKSRRQNVEWDIDRIQSRIRDSESKQSRIREEIRTLRTESAGL